MTSGTTGNAPVIENVGLLFVHGIGEQKRFEHLTESVSQFAELMKQSGDAGETIGCSVVDRTQAWLLPPNSPDPNHTAPIEVTLRSTRRHVVLHCHEVWWADLGARSGLRDALNFWLWGFGQWCAPIYRELDAAQLDKTKRPGTSKLSSTLAILPTSVASEFGAEPIARIRLGLAGLSALLVSISWVLAKRVFKKLLGLAASPTLIVEYVGDVRTYEERATPGDTAVSDPGYPRRVGIRRRMVTEMVAMGSNADLDRWYVVAHSQGTVLAYNGLTEIGHALPNYLTRGQWRALPARFKRDANCVRRPDVEIAEMMPGRPRWLVAEDVVNRPELFGKLAGFLTYGSPLNKFAALWPRIVATATDRTLESSATSVFSETCRWINLHAPQDPVAGNLDRYTTALSEFLVPHIPELESYATPFCIDYLLAHIGYFKGGEAVDHSPALRQRRAVMRWLMEGTSSASPSFAIERPLGRFSTFVVIDLAYLLIVGFLLIVATGFLAALGGVTKALLSNAHVVIGGWPDVGKLLAATINLVWAVTAIALIIMLAAGLRRWWQESNLNRRIAGAEKRKAGLALQHALKRAKLAAARSDDEELANAKAQDSLWKTVTMLHRLQLAAASVSILVSPIVIWFAGWAKGEGWLGVFCRYVDGLLGLRARFAATPLPKWVPGLEMHYFAAAITLAVLGCILFAIVLQTMTNLWIRPLRPQ